MKAVKVQSSNLAAVAVDGDDLLIRFRSGARYRYPGAVHLAPELLAAESAGKFFHARVRRLPCVCERPANAERRADAIDRRRAASRAERIDSE